MNQYTHILLIEDDPAVTRSLRGGLEQAGYAVNWQSSGRAGLEYARSHTPHLIILDIRLPDGSGLDFCRQMRQLKLRQPIVMLTAQHDEMDKVLGLEPGQALSRAQILEAVWGYDAAVRDVLIADDRTVNVHIRRLREKVEPDPSRPTHILTVPGIGYRLAT